jgi:hypothetical protein
VEWIDPFMIVGRAVSASGTALGWLVTVVLIATQCIASSNRGIVFKLGRFGSLVMFPLSGSLYVGLASADCSVFTSDRCMPAVVNTAAASCVLFIASAVLLGRSRRIEHEKLL